MKKYYTFLNLIFLVFLESETTIAEVDNDSGIDPVDYALEKIGYTRERCTNNDEWRLAFERLADPFMQQDARICLLSVMPLIRNHMSTLVSELNRFSNLTQNGAVLDEIKESDISDNEIPSECCSSPSMKTDFKETFVKWYRILKNSHDSRVREIKKAMQQEELKGSRSELGIAAELAKLWTIVNNDFHSHLSVTLYFDINWSNGQDVASAFMAFEEDDDLINLTRILFDETKFKYSNVVE